VNKGLRPLIRKKQVIVGSRIFLTTNS